MCGIWLIFGTDQCVSKQTKSCLEIQHRGPDCFRIESIPQLRSCAFGFHRLTLVDSIRGMQPMRLHDMPHLWLCYNGEIYNHKLIEKEFDFKYETRLDGECALHLYQRGGIEFACQQLDGVFGLSILDTDKQLLHIARDTFGVRPLFKMHAMDGTFAACSEAKGLTHLVHNQIQFDVNWVQPGTYETYSIRDDGKLDLLVKKQFHSIGKPPMYKTLVPSYEDNVSANIRNLLKAAVRKRLMAERRIGCLLSGGLDSSLIASLVIQTAREEGIDYPIQTFSTGMPGSPDLEAARKVAAHIGSDHHEVLFSPEEGISVLNELIYHLETYDITTVRASVGMYILSKYISQKTDNIVVFTGEGADEVAQGYIYFHKAPDTKTADDEGHRLLKDLFYFDVLRADRSTSAHGLECRVPFLDHQFTSYYLSLPAKDRQPKNGVEKYLLRKAFASTKLLPDEILWRPKEAFSDGVSSVKKGWFEILQEFVETQVSNEELRQASQYYLHNTPWTKEALYYRKIFENHYMGRSSWIPYFWMPKWTDTNDPSARTLKHYKHEQTFTKVPIHTKG